MSGAAPAISRGVPSGDSQSMRLPSGSILRFLSAASAIDMPPPYEPPVAPIASGSMRPSSTRSAIKLLRVANLVAGVHQADVAVVARRAARGARRLRAARLVVAAGGHGEGGVALVEPAPHAAEAELRAGVAVEEHHHGVRAPRRRSYGLGREGDVDVDRDAVPGRDGRARLGRLVRAEADARVVAGLHLAVDRGRGVREDLGDLGLRGARGRESAQRSPRKRRATPRIPTSFLNTCLPAHLRPSTPRRGLIDSSATRE